MNARRADLFIPGRVGPKGSHKPGKGKLRNDSAHGKAWEKLVADLTFVAGFETLQPPYVIELDFLFERPKRSKYGYPASVDIDKCARSTLDGLKTGGLILDDRHVISLSLTAAYATLTPAGCAVHVKTI